MRTHRWPCWAMFCLITARTVNVFGMKVEQYHSNGHGFVRDKYDILTLVTNPNRMRFNDNLWISFTRSFWLDSKVFIALHLIFNGHNTSGLKFETFWIGNSVSDFHIDTRKKQPWKFAEKSSRQNGDSMTKLYWS